MAGEYSENARREKCASQIYDAFYEKTLSIFVVLIMFMYSHCLAKQIYDNTGRISFETSDEWFYASGEDDIATYHLPALHWIKIL